MAGIKSTTYSQAIKGGALTVNDSTYVERPIDNELYEFLIAEGRETRIPCVLAPRQSGKSSLMVRLAHQLNAKKNICVQINIQGLGISLGDDSTLYLTILKEIISNIVQQQNLKLNILSELEFELYDFWRNASQLTPAVRFQDHLKKLLTQFTELHLIVFLDEIQSLISWQIQDSFLGCLRSISGNEIFLQCKFVLLGVAKPNDLLSSAEVAFNSSVNFEISEFSSDCEPLLKGLRDIFSEQAQEIFDEILRWTGGQPFLTQHLCHLSVIYSAQLSNQKIEQFIQDLIDVHILNDWRSKDPLGHFHDIENWFKKGYTPVTERINSLKLYQQLVENKKKISFEGDNGQHINLLISGLACKKNQYLISKNLIYPNIFDLEWTQQVSKYLTKGEQVYMPSKKLQNRAVYVLIDQSASMYEEDPGTSKSRWELLGEALSGDARKLTKDYGGWKICERFVTYLYTRNRVGNRYEVEAEKLKKNIFAETTPESNTFIVPTFRAALEEWKRGPRENGQKAIFLIYSDGMLDDRPQFEELVHKLCGDIKDEEEAKIVIVGLGADVENDPLPFILESFN